MNITEVKTAIKIANIEKNWNIVYDINIDKKLLTNDSGRVYIITSNGIIKKIGGSQSKGGIKSTLGPYKSAMKGNPSLRSFGIHKLVENEINNGNIVEIYLIISAEIEITAEIKGLFNTEVKIISPFHDMENKCKYDYKSIVGKYPEWNYQENGKKWPTDIREQYEYIKK